MRELDEAARQQDRTDEQQHGERRLDDQQRVAKRVRARASEAAGARAVAAVQRVVQVHARAAQRGREPGQERGRERGDDTARDCPRVDAHGVEPREIGRGHRGRKPYERRRETQSERAADAGEHEAFGEQLPRQTTAAGAERRADGQLALARDAAREKQVRDVRAGD